MVKLLGFAESVKFGTAAAFTVRVKAWVALGSVPLAAVKVMGKLPLAVGVPLNIPVEAVKVTPPGSAPDSLRVIGAVPVAVTWNEPAVPTVKAALLALVMVGATEAAEWKARSVPSVPAR